MPTFLLEHHHTPDECRTAYAAWRGYDSPLRHRTATASCASGGHRLIWTVHADSNKAALAQLPPWVADRARAEQVTEVKFP